jgi:tetratricopeptide (TPR) repeat protein
MFAQPEADQLVQAAAAALSRGQVAQAATLLDEAIRADPHHPMALTKQAEVALMRKDHADALALIGAALAIEPNFAPAWNQRAFAYWLAGRQTDAVLAGRQAVNIQPSNPDFRLRLAQFAAWSGRGAEAREALAPLLQAKQHDPLNYAAAVSRLGELAIAEGRFDEASPYLDHALELHQGLDSTRMLRGMNRLRLGQFRAGWADYAAREAIPELYPDSSPKLADQAWQDQALSGKTLVVTDDQGYGDAIQFFRYLPLLRDRGAAHVTWRTFAPLARLFGDAAPYATVVNALAGNERFDFHSNSTNLPRWFGTELPGIPAGVPYLRPPAHLKSAMRLPAGRRLKVGLVWSGDTRHSRDHLRSIPADLFLRLTDVPGIRFHSLQHEVRAADLPALTARPAIGREVEKAVDFADTAALIARLDLVITVDTGIAHLAGALGKPVWTMLHVAPDWRWLTERSDSPWYPTARLFRMTPTEWLGPERSKTDRPGIDEAAKGAGWGPVLARVSAALRAFAAG